MLLRERYVIFIQFVNHYISTNTSYSLYVRYVGHFALSELHLMCMSFRETAVLLSSSDRSHCTERIASYCFKEVAISRTELLNAD
jgi:hypothetical protein